MLLLLATSTKLKVLLVMNLVTPLYVGISMLVIATAMSCSIDNKDDGIIDYYDLGDLPTDTGGVHIGNPLGATGSPYGYYIYKPSHHDAIEGIVYPLMVFLHGSGEKGESVKDPKVLDYVLKNGPPALIKAQKWNPPYPFIVATPQCHEGSWDASKLKGFVTYLLKNYKVNIRRIYVTGLSMGGRGTFVYAGTYADDSYVAAIVPICGSGILNQAENYANIPIWAFHGDADKTVPVEGSLHMIQAIREAGINKEAKVSIFSGAGHNVWTRTYDNSGIGESSPDYDPFNQSIYSWLYQYERRDLDTLIGSFR